MLPVLINGLLQKELVCCLIVCDRNSEYSMRTHAKYIYFLYFQFRQFERSLDSADPSKVEAVRLLKENIESIRSGTIVPVYSSFDGFKIDITWILNQYLSIFNG